MSFSVQLLDKGTLGKEMRRIEDLELKYAQQMEYETQLRRTEGIELRYVHTQNGRNGAQIYMQSVKSLTWIRGLAVINRRYV